MYIQAPISSSTPRQQFFLGIKERISRATEMTQQALADSQAENQTLVSIERQLDYIEQQLKLINPAQYQETVDKFSRTFKELEGQVNDTQKFIAEMTKLVSLRSRSSTNKYDNFMNSLEK